MNNLDLSQSAKASFPKPRTPTLARHKALLSEDVFRQSTFGQPIPAGVPLIPLEDCDRVISELEGALVPCGEVAGLVFAKMLINSYRRSKNDLVEDEFVDALVKAFEKLPGFVAEDVIDEVTRTKAFLPNRADIEKVAQHRRLRYANALWLAKKHKEAQEKKRQAETDERSRQERSERFKALREEFGELPVIELIRLDKERRGEA